MSNRHKADPGSWPSIIRRLEEIVVAGGGVDPLREILKLQIASLFLESHQESNADLVAGGPVETKEHIGRSLRSAEREWPTILNGDTELKISAEQAMQCSLILDQVSVLDSGLESIDSIFEALVATNSKASRGQFFTPRHVVEAMVRLVNPAPGERVADPACGSGGFLLHALSHINKSSANGADSVAIRESSLWGFDVDQLAIQMCKVMLLVSGARPENAVQLNSLLTPQANESLFSLDPREMGLTVEEVFRSRGVKDDGFDVILTNPPFAGEVTDQSLRGSYELSAKRPRVERDVLFLERCVKLLKPRGRMAIVMPTGRFGGKSSSYARSWLLRNFRVLAVLSLGRDTFRPYTSQKAEVIVGYRRDRPISDSSYLTEEILFLSSEHSGKDSRGNVIVKDPGAAAMWDRSDHDLADGISIFEKHLSVSGIDWGGAQ